MKKSKNLKKVSFDFAYELFKMKDSFPEDEKTFMGMEIVKEAVSVCACISNAVQVDCTDVKEKLLQEAFSATFRIEVLLEISRDLNYLDTVDEQLHTLGKIRTRLEKLIKDIKFQFPY